MKLSTRSQYGLRALIALARKSDNTPTPLKVLALENNLPVKYLEQVLLALRNHGILIAQSGTHGGYKFAKPPSEITLGQVIRILDGTLAPLHCISKIAYAPCSCPDEHACTLRYVMNEVRDAIVGIVDNRTIYQVAFMEVSNEDVFTDI